MQGTIKNLVNGKLYGFIRDSMDNELFFHREDFSGHWDDLVFDFAKGKGQHILVEFDVVENPKGKRAANVRRLEYPNQAV